MISKILLQSETVKFPEALAIQHANFLLDKPYSVFSSSFGELSKHYPVDGSALPVGSVQYVRQCLHLFGKSITEIPTYPADLLPFLRRPVDRRVFRAVPGDCFVKPQKLKMFTGAIKCELQASIDPEEPVWCSPKVQWVSEWRYYILNGEIIGAGRYDDGPDDTPVPETEIVRQAVLRWSNAPSAYSLDFGVLVDGETALVEANDAWALGYYKGTLSPRQYLRLLETRWRELLEQADRKSVV